jgi:hypothetical protein
LIPKACHKRGGESCHFCQILAAPCSAAGVAAWVAANISGSENSSQRRSFLYHLMAASGTKAPQVILNTENMHLRIFSHLKDSNISKYKLVK